MSHRVVQTSTRTLGRRSDRTGRFDREVGDSSIGTMNTKDGMEQNGDKNDEGTFSHFSRNHYVDTRLLDTGRRGPEGNGRLVSRQIDPVEDTPVPSSDKLGNISVRVTPPEMGQVLLDSPTKQFV